jgi:hypothetical protein
MTISNELIKAVARNINEQPDQNPNDRVKYIHIRKDVLLNDFDVSLDGKTFNGRDHMKAKFFPMLRDSDGNVKLNTVTFNFDAFTFAYKQNDNGDLDVAIVFKSPKDEYRKRIGAELANTVLQRYLNSNKKAYEVHYTDVCGYHAFVYTIETADIVRNNFILPESYTRKLSVSDLKNSLVLGILKDNAHQLLKGINIDSKVETFTF